jgi:uncharacterized protein (DUF2267 family)
MAEREGIYTGSLDRVGLQQAERHTRAVFDVLRLVLDPDDIDGIAERLPDEVRGLLREARVHPRPTTTAEQFVERVARRVRIDRELALGATEAVLEALGERLAAGEAEDLERLLPGELRPAVELGILRSGRKAVRLSLDEFVSRISEREHTTLEDSIDFARAVFATLREALPERELDDILAELPHEYDEIIGRVR